MIRHRFTPLQNINWQTTVQEALKTLENKKRGLCLNLKTIPPSSASSIIVCGATGLLGNSILKTLNNARPGLTMGTSRNNEAGFIYLNVGDRNGLRESIVNMISQLPRGRSVICNTLALSSPNQCKNNPELVQRINIIFPSMLADVCGSFPDKEILLMHMSSEVVYWYADRTSSKSFRETTPLNVPAWDENIALPTESYFRSKALGEKYLMETTNNLRNVKVMALRSGLLAGHDPRVGAMIWQREVTTRLRENSPVSVYRDQTRHLTSLEEEAIVLANIAARFLTGESDFPKIVNLAGSRSISRQQMAKMIVSVAGILNPNICLVECPKEAFTRIPLDTTLARSIGMGLDLSPSQTIALTHYMNVV